MNEISYSYVFIFWIESQIAVHEALMNNAVAAGAGFGGSKDLDKTIKKEKKQLVQQIKRFKSCKPGNIVVPQQRQGNREVDSLFGNMINKGESEYKLRQKRKKRKDNK